MDINILNSILGEQGVSGVIVVCFILMVFWNIKKMDKMQEKLFHLTDTMSDEMPDIKSHLEKISDNSSKTLDILESIEKRIEARR